MPTRPERFKLRRGAEGAPDASRKPAPRPSASKRGYDAKWEQARRGYLAHHPLCVHCLARGDTIASTDVDHIDPHRGDMRKFWNRDNWQALCHTCHSRKTATEDGGFGRQRLIRD